MRTLVAFLLVGATLTIVPGSADAATSWCGTQGVTLFCDDFTTNQGWTKSGYGLQPCGSDIGQCYNPTDWLKSTRGWDYGVWTPNGDSNSWFVGVQGGGQDLGYLAPQPFGLFLGGIIAGKGAAWYDVRNVLTSPLIDATGAQLTTMSYAVKGSSEGSLYDRLEVWVQVAGGGTTMLGSYAGNQIQGDICNCFYTFPFSAAWLSGQKFQFLFIFIEDANTDSVTPPPCLAVSVPTGQSPPIPPNAGCPVGATVCAPALFSGSGCLYGGMGFWVDDVIVRKLTKAPIAQFVYKYKPVCEGGFHVDFTDGSVDTDGTVAAWNWDFGDKTTSNQQNPSHDYQSEGTYKVVEDIQDNEGNPAQYIFTIILKYTKCPEPGSTQEPIPMTVSEGNQAQTRPPHDGTDPAAAGLDTDGDGVPDAIDLCPAQADDQADSDGDGIGDACDVDADNDGIINPRDNCATVPNPGQANLDGDEEGDACDADIDGDGVPDAADNCPSLTNKDQADLNADGAGDACQIVRNAAEDKTSEVGASAGTRTDSQAGLPRTVPAGSPTAGIGAIVLGLGLLAVALVVALRRRS
ncbi:MAG: thrombospondin type 3 repeat-containing protein [bacterium]